MLILAAGQSAVAATPVKLALQGTSLTWTAQEDLAASDLRVTGPAGFVFEKRFASSMPALSLAPQGVSLPDGQYNYEIIALRALPGADLSAFEKAQTRADGGLSDAALAAKMAAYSQTISGTFRISGGQAFFGQPATEAALRRDAEAGAMVKDQVIADDLIVQGSTCVGFDCVNNESFGFDTIRLKENNLRIKFEDTSVGAFPSTDWQLTANDSASGGANRFSIEDITSARIPFTVTGGAPTNSMFIDSTGRLGLRTATPVLDLHIATSNTPAHRLEQNSSGGFTAQTWDIAGNEANFFVRDVTSGSRLPFRIRPGAPTSSLDISSDGNVGIGTASASTNLHVSRLSPVQSEVGVRISNSVGSWDIKNNASGRINFTDDTTGTRVPFKIALNSDNNLLRVGVASASTVDVNGILTVNGTFNNLSSRTQKDLLAGMGIEAVLNAVARLPLYTWAYKHENGVRHFGPLAEDFHARFGLGTDERHISPSDVAGVALAATQALNEVVASKEREISELRTRLGRLERILGQLLKDAETR
jgi:hypothetical protein